MHDRTCCRLPVAWKASTTMYREIWRPAGALQGGAGLSTGQLAALGRTLGQHVSTRYGGRGIQTTRSSADSSDGVVKNESGSERRSPQYIPWYRLELRRGADGTDLAGRSSRLAGRDGDELDVYGRARLRTSASRTRT